MTETQIKKTIECADCGVEFQTIIVQEEFPEGLSLNICATRCDLCIDKRQAGLERLTRPPGWSHPKEAIPQEFRNYSRARLKRSAERELTKIGARWSAGRLILTGATGSGKSYIATHLAYRRIAQGGRIFWTSGAAIKKSLRPDARSSAQESNALLAHRLANSAYCIIDDLGHGNWTVAYGELILEALGQRAAGKTTIITSQYPPDRWAQHIVGDCPAETIAAITRRFSDYYREVSLADD